MKLNNGIILNRKRDFEEQSSPLLEIHFYLRNWMQTASYQQFFVICSCLLFVISRDERFVKFLSEVSCFPPIHGQQSGELCTGTLAARRPPVNRVLWENMANSDSFCFVRNCKILNGSMGLSLFCK